MPHSPSITAFLRQIRGDASGGVVGLLTNIPLFKAAFEEASLTTYQEEGADVLTSNTLNFVGPGVTLTDIVGVATVTISGAGTVDWEEEGAAVVTSGTLNAVGIGVTITDVAGIAILTVPGTDFQDEGSSIVESMTLDFIGAGVTMTDVAGVATAEISGELPTFHITHEKGSGVASGATAASTQNIRTLNTIKKNTITGASLTADVVTLPAGDYYCRGWCAAFQVNRAKPRLRDTTAGATILLGASGLARVSATADSFLLPIDGYFTLGVSSDLEFQMFSAVANATDGLGFAASTGEDEVYAMIKFEKLD